jgi:glycerol-3-phosphate acyltransferase PlsX
MSVGITIAVDAMSGDDGPQVVVPAVFAYLEKFQCNDTSHSDSVDEKSQVNCSQIHPSKAFNIILVGRQDELKALSHSYPQNASVSIVHAESVVSMDDKPSRVLRGKQDSSMAVALGLVRSGEAQACVSAGNTGALMMLGRSILGTFPGIDRPAITKLFPSQGGGCFVLDLGANVDSSAEHLLQFAIMGQVLAKITKGVENPKVALLNVGGESIKGNEQVRLAASLIQESEALNYIGFAEGGDIFRSYADVIVCDGFVGNVALKSAEGAAKILLTGIKDFFKESWYQKLLGRLMLPLLAKTLKQLDPDTHNGAIFLGLQGVLVKSHGHASAKSFEQAIELAHKEAEAKLPDLINEELEKVLL